METATKLKTYNEEQSAALLAMQQFMADDEAQFFILEGPAGTGKTYTIEGLLPLIRGKIVFTAPTNKATRVIKEVLTKPDYTPDCRTIYSLLGLRLQANGEIKELAVPEDEVDLTSYRLVVVDEASMINAQLMGFIREAADTTGVKFIFMGDPYQLPPVKETTSPVWSLPNGARLATIMRQDNTILDLVTVIRGAINHPAPRWKVEDANDGKEGVWRCNAAKFRVGIDRAAANGMFQKANGAKIIAWRNATVDTYNRYVRRVIFQTELGAELQDWVEGDRISLLEPANDLDGQKQASTDDEGSVTMCSIARHPVHSQFKCWSLKCTLDDNRLIHLWLIHPESQNDFEIEKERLAIAARANPRNWGAYWEFCESFHKARHGYAITAHRAQGSTYEAAFVDMGDILVNRNIPEARRCLYVACSRPKKLLFIV